MFSFNRKLDRWLDFGGNVPRKVKKAFLPNKLSYNEVIRMIKRSVLVERASTMYERPYIIPYGLFCSKCGCDRQVGTGNKTNYPEHWEDFYCMRCRNTVAYIDNSPYIHELEEIIPVYKKKKKLIFSR